MLSLETIIAQIGLDSVSWIVGGLLTLVASFLCLRLRTLTGVFRDWLNRGEIGRLGKENAVLRQLLQVHYESTKELLDLNGPAQVSPDRRRNREGQVWSTSRKG